MSRIVIIFSLLLIGLGLVAYFLFADAENRSCHGAHPGVRRSAAAALWVDRASSEGARKASPCTLAMVFALLGFLAPLGRLIPTSIKNGFVFDSKSGTMIAMSVLCLMSAGARHPVLHRGAPRIGDGMSEQIPESALRERRVPRAEQAERMAFGHGQGRRAW